MQRRTNLFYKSGQDSNFITFSNYTESLTGSFISTDWKLFPSKFICLNIPALNDPEVKSEFIKYCVSYYENKLAFVRDWCVNTNRKIDENILPLEWLFETLTNKFGKDNVKVTFVSKIVEQNFNGVYADTICTIDGTDSPRNYKIVDNDEADLQIPYKQYPYTNEASYLSQRYLYGWYRKHNNGEIITDEYIGVAEYENVEPTLDGETYYSITPKYQSLEIDEENNQPLESIDFNIVIPLFDLTNLNPQTNRNNILIDTENVDYVELTTQLGTNEEDKINIPLGIWFANTQISLKRDGNTGYAPAWSLVLSSQFKPFPYSEQLSSDGPEGIQGVAYTEGAYVTFAQVLARQNEMITNFSKLSAQIAQLSSKIESVDAKVNSLGTSYTIDALHTEMIRFKNQVNNLLEQYGISNDTSLTWDAKFNG